MTPTKSTAPAGTPKRAPPPPRPQQGNGKGESSGVMKQEVPPKVDSEGTQLAVVPGSDPGEQDDCAPPNKKTKIVAKGNVGKRGPTLTQQMVTRLDARMDSFAEALQVLMADRERGGHPPPPPTLQAEQDIPTPAPPQQELCLNPAGPAIPNSASTFTLPPAPPLAPQLYTPAGPSAPSQQLPLPATLPFAATGPLAQFSTAGSALPSLAGPNPPINSESLDNFLTPPMISMETQLVSIPIADKYKNKILAGQYVDFLELLSPPSPQSQTDTSAAIRMGGDGSFPLSSQEPTPKRKLPITDREWHRAFLAFASVHLSLFPHETQQMMAYGHFVSTMMAEGKDWRAYDFAFRWERQHQAVKIRWDHFHLVHYAKAAYPTHGPARGTFSSYTPSSSRQNPYIPTGYCRAFHDPTTKCPLRYDACPYKHLCPKCEGRHTIAKHYREFKDSNKPSSHNRFQRHGQHEKLGVKRDPK